MKKFRKLTERQRDGIVWESKLMLAGCRDALWNRWESKYPGHVRFDPHKVPFITDGYYGEAFGIMRALNVLGYGYFGSNTLSAVAENRSAIPEHNLKWWCREIEHDYLVEEGFYGTPQTCSIEKCKELLSKYRELVRK